LGKLKGKFKNPTFSNIQYLLTHFKIGKYKSSTQNYTKKFTGTMGGKGVGKQTVRPNAIPTRKKKKMYRKPPIVSKDD